MIDGGPVLVTGGAGHLGRSIVHALAGRGAPVAVTDIDQAAAQELAASLETDVAVFAADLTEEDAVRGLVEAVTERFGSLDVVVNAAGIEGPVARIESLKSADVEKVFAVNVMSVFSVCTAIVPHMKKRQRGRIINMASGAGQAGGALTSPYSASKHAVVGLTRSLARELAADGIAVNAVCPGYVDSPMVERILSGEMSLTGSRPDVLSAIPMGRMADPGEVAAIVAFLAFDAPQYMTGSCLVVDGALRA